MNEPIGGVLLAGGQARRMGGGGKGRKVLGGAWLIEHAIARIRPQVDPLILNINSPEPGDDEFGLPLVPDAIGDFSGPLAGVLTGMEWMRDHAPSLRWMASFAVDAPFLPENLVLRLYKAAMREEADLACAMSSGRTHPVFGLWKVSLAPDLRRAMETEDMRKIDLWTARYNIVHVDFDVEPMDPFFNVNRPEDLAQAARFLA